MSAKIEVTPEVRQELVKVSKQLDIRHKTDRDIFYDLCFCICAPQTTFVNNSAVNQALIEADFFCCSLTQDELHKIVRPARFFRNKTKWLLEAKKKFGAIKAVVRSLSTPDAEKREWLVKNVKGLGMKAASHFLRNLGARELAIVDVHVLKFLGAEGHPSSQTEYLRLEGRFARRAKRMGLSVGELDMLVWQAHSGTPWLQFDK